MKVIKRNNCISCGSLLRDLQHLRQFPIFMGTTTQERVEDVSADMTFAKCVNCNCIQMRNLIPLDILYAEGHCRSVGETWRHHHESFGEFVLKHAAGNIVEVGGAHLILANYIEKSKDVKSVTVYDTNITGTPSSDKITTREEFFDHSTVSSPPDAIVHSHVIEHLYDPLREIESMSNLLNNGGKMIISAPLVDNMMSDGFTNAMNFEHTYGLSRKLLHRIVNNAGMRVVDEHEFSRHCIFLAAEKDENLVIHQEFGVEDPSYYHDFISYHDAEVKKINTLLANPRETFIFGAHIFTQFLLGYGLQEESFSFILDNDVKKQNQRLYGTNLQVTSPKILRDFNCPTVVLKAGQYTEEIKKDIIENINSNTRFIL